MANNNTTFKKNVVNAILILHLPTCLEKDALEELSKVIRRSKIKATSMNHLGLEVFFAEFKSVHDAMAIRSIHVGDLKYSIHLLVTPMTIHGIVPFINTDKSAFESYIHKFDIIGYYHEEKLIQNKMTYTENYRIIVEKPDITKKGILKMFEWSGKKFQVSLYCRRCLGDGHFQHECPNRIYISNESMIKESLQKDLNKGPEPRKLGKSIHNSKKPSDYSSPTYIDGTNTKKITLKEPVLFADRLYYPTTSNQAKKNKSNEQTERKTIDNN